MAVLAMIFSMHGVQHAHAGAWYTAADMITGRDSHTLTLLPNSKLLAVGGLNTAGNSLAVAELYDPATNTWTATAALAPAAARYGQTANPLPNGKVLVAGGGKAVAGYTTDVFKNAYLYDPVLGIWALTGSMKTARVNFTATLLADGRVLVTGGYSRDPLTGRDSITKTAEIYDPATEAWTDTAPMSTIRKRHTATMLANGKVLVVGGETSDGIATNLAELYDPATGTWTPAGALAAPASYHTTTRLPNNMVLVVGGKNGSTTLATAQLYNPATNTWAAPLAIANGRFDHSATLLPNGQLLVLGGNNGTQAMTSAGQYNYLTDTWSVPLGFVNARMAHTATTLPSGKLLIAGGWNNSISMRSVEVLDLASGSFASSGNLTGSSRGQHAATLLANGKVLLAGGSNGPALNNVDLYDPATGTTTDGGPLAVARYGHTLTQLQDGKVLVTGGTNGTTPLAGTQLYNPVAGTWATAGTMGVARELHTATLLPDGRVLVAGGKSTTGTYLATAQLYTPSSETWTTTGSLSTSPRHGHTATLLPNGKVLVVGGKNGSTTLATAELYDPGTGIWAATGSLTTGVRSTHTATLLPNGKVLVAGGYSGTTYLATAELYDPGTGTWTATGSLTTGARGSHTATLLPVGKVLLVGGYNGSTSLSSAELYDPVTGAWTATAALTTGARSAHTATLLADGRVLVAGGSNGGAYYSSTELYDTGLGYLADWQPQIIAPPSAFMLGSAVSLTGTNFRGFSSTSSGTMQDSPANFPIAQFYSVESCRTLLLTTTGWSDTSYSSAPFLGMPAGTAILTMTVNGISAAVLTQISKAPASISLYGLSQAKDGNPKSVTATTNPSGLAVTFTYTGANGTTYTTSATPPTLVGEYTVMATINDQNYYGTTTGVLVISNIAGSTASSPLFNTRYAHSATLLNNGKILIAGGQRGTTTLNTAELYDPDTGAWAPTGTMRAVRIGHTATLLPNGKVLVAGGANDLTSAELYDPVSGTWSLTAFPMAEGRKYHSATLLSNGYVLVIGGQNLTPAIASAELYNPETGVWTSAGSMAERRYNHTAALLPNGKVLVCGGFGGGAGPISLLSSAELYTPPAVPTPPEVIGNGTWTSTAGPMTHARYNHTATVLANGKILVAAGRASTVYGSLVPEAELYDPTAGTWSPAGSMNFGRYLHTATLLPNGWVLFAGGTNRGVSGMNSYGDEVINVDIYNPATAAWMTLSPALALTGKRYNHTATLLASGKVLIAGGYFGAEGSGTVINTVELFDFALGSWSAATPTNTARSSHTATLLPDGKVLVAGGTNGTTTYSSAEIYTITDDVWTATTGGMLAARHSHTATLLTSGKVLVTGGSDGTALDSAELFDPGSGLWSAAGTLGTTRYLHTATLLADGRVLISGGRNTSDTPLDSAEIYDPLTNIWAPTGALHTARAAHSATLLTNGMVLVTAGDNGILPATAELYSAELYDPLTGVWSLTGDLAEARKNHTTTLLPGGKVLMTGGSHGTAYLNTAQLYDPGSGAWAAPTTFTTARARHSASVLTNGKVLVGGGRGTSGLCSTAELFDPVTGVWKTTGYPGTKRESHSATMLPNGRVLAVGGSGTSGTLSSAETYHLDLDLNAASKSSITFATLALVNGNSLTLSGSNFRGIYEASGGNGSQNSSSNFPVVQLRALDSGLTAVMQAASWSPINFVSTAVTGLPEGYAMVTVFVNGIPGNSTFIRIVPPPPAPVVMTSITTNSGTLDPVFSAVVTDYQVVLPYATSTISITATTSDASQVSVNGVSVPSGQPSPDINLDVGLNNVNVVLYDAYNGTSTYHISVTASFAATRPVNDDFANATIIPGTGATVSGSNVGATLEPGEPVHAGVDGGKSVWWRWTATTSGQSTIDTLGSDFDTLLAVYTGSSVASGSLTTVASNDDAVGTQSQVTFDAVAGTTYQIAVAGAYSQASESFDAGNITLKVTAAAGGYAAMYANWAAAANLTADNALPEAIPFGDGVKNLLKYAFNMDGSGPDVQVLVGGTGTLPGAGNSGLPAITLDRSGPQPVLRFEYLQRKNSGLIYTPLISVDLTSWSPPGTAPSTSDVTGAPEWERVIIAEPCDPAVKPRCFGKVMVELP
jgi:N-acetylneuraminic acid mutarotase